MIKYLNEKCGTKYRYTNKSTIEYINDRLKEKYTVDDLKLVIRKKCDDWIGTEMEKFLRPKTLFGDNFEGYLNERSGKKKSKNRFNNFHQREYDFEDLEKKMLNR